MSMTQGALVLVLTSIFGLCFMPVCLMKSNCYSIFIFFFGVHLPHLKFVVIPIICLHENISRNILILMWMSFNLDHWWGKRFQKIGMFLSKSIRCDDTLINELKIAAKPTFQLCRLSEVSLVCISIGFLTESVVGR